MFDRILNATLKVAEGLRRSFHHWGYTKDSWTVPLNSLDLHQTQKQKMKSWTDTGSSFHFPETVQVFSNLTPMRQSSINPQWKKNKSSLAETSASTLPYLIIMAKGEGGESNCSFCKFLLPLAFTNGPPPRFWKL